MVTSISLSWGSPWSNRTIIIFNMVLISTILLLFTRSKHRFESSQLFIYLRSYSNLFYYFPALNIFCLTLIWSIFNSFGIRNFSLLSYYFMFSNIGTYKLTGPLTPIHFFYLSINNLIDLLSLASY